MSFSKVSADLLQIIIRSEIACLILLDYSRAFDMIIYGLLLQKLQYYGFSCIVCKWFENYLRGRRQVVKLDGEESDLVQVTRGVPQGSVLGPVLFNVHIQGNSNSTLTIGISESIRDTRKFKLQCHTQLAWTYIVTKVYTWLKLVYSLEELRPLATLVDLVVLFVNKKWSVAAV